MRTVLVTGASSGIGRACAKAFLEAGDRVVAHYRSGETAVTALRRQFGEDRVVPVSGDFPIKIMGESNICKTYLNFLTKVQIIV